MAARDVKQRIPGLGTVLLLLTSNFGVDRNRGTRVLSHYHIQPARERAARFPARQYLSGTDYSH